MANLTNSTTTVQKATYVPLNIVLPERYSGRVAIKFGYIRQLDLQPGEVAAVRNAIAEATAATPGRGLADPNFWSALQQFEGTPLVSQLPSPSVFANIAEADLTTFGNGLTTIRKQAVQRLQQATTTVPAVPAGAAQPAARTLSLSIAQNYLNTSSVATNAFAANASTSNMGRLNLERLEMTPAGVERGALLATIPLAPKERTSVVQQEWSVTSKEFTSIVTDSLENYSQTGVTENTQLTQATASQVSHSNQFNVSASVSGGIGFVSGSVGTSFGSQDQSSQSANDSRQHAIQTTRQASSRVKQSHKITISTSTVTGASQTSTRMFENPSATDPMRVDYFSLMRRWYVALYRYGLRLTYDITVPEPGGTLRETYATLALLNNLLSNQFIFPYKHSDISTDTKPGDTEPYYLVLADKYDVDVPSPPGPTIIINVNVGFTHNTEFPGHPASFNVPAGYWIEQILYVSWHAGSSSFDFSVFADFGGATIDGNTPFNTDLCANGAFLWHQSGQQSITVYYKTGETPGGSLSFNVVCKPTDAAWQQWQANVWNALYNAAQAAFYANQQQVNAQIQTLQNKIANVDTLTLRREENDEIMKCVLRWLLGPNFEFMPSTLVDDLKLANLTNNEAIFNGVNFTGNAVNFLNPAVDWSLMSWDQARVNFINQAIDWDNVLYFLYSYFWDIPTSWDFIRQIQHPDSTRQAFLRAGSARVVLTVRKGWETAWTYFVETGVIPPPGPIATGGNPYLTIAQQIADYDNTNYPGIPAANPNGGGPIDDDTPQIGTTCAADIHPGATATTPVTIPVASSIGFVAGATAIIDNWNATDSTGKSIQETQTITAVPDATHITVQGLLHAHSAANGAFPIVQASAKGLLIGEWYEYTPTSGTDIAIATPSGTKNCDNTQFGNS